MQSTVKGVKKKYTAGTAVLRQGKAGWEGPQEKLHPGLGERGPAVSRKALRVWAAFELTLVLLGRSAPAQTGPEPGSSDPYASVSFVPRIRDVHRK